MRPKSLLLLALALGCGLVASIGISQVLDSNNKKQASIETVPIYVALQNINLGDPVNDGMVSLQEWPRDKVPVGAITKWEEIESRRPKTTIFQGEPLNDGKFLAKGETHDPISGIPPGMRLKTVSVDARKSAAGLLSPGDRVDVQLYIPQNERQGIPHAFTKIILQNIRVYAVDQTVQRTAEGTEERSVAKTLSLVVTPQQASRMTTAENMGELSLIPRHPDDDLIVDDAEQSLEDIFARSDSSNREKERAAFDKSDEDIEASLRKDMSHNPTVAVEPPFRMKLIFPNEVSQVDFDNTTGEPLEAEDDYNTYRPTDSVDMESGEEESSGPDFSADNPDGKFPIDFE
ncbi:SAF domain protein [Bythopirellula goksoeyrii]|uniref:SAF domain protein n=2 Tax=Bythopirellula goksoeyrii TaxID=1400387 RepID=A0A5B9QKD2_9BACT|nr:SAF domain protein [Bythopirellula goksoeyrii]